MAKKAQNMSRNKISATTQKYLDIAEIKEDVVIMRNGTLRAVIMVASINFSLKSEEEQNAIIAAYVGFLNNINFPLQIVIQSRELNIDAYLDNLREREKEQTNDLLKIQTAEYINYVSELVSMSKIMNKKFYVVIPYNPLASKDRKFITRIIDTFRPASVIKMKEERFQKRKAELQKMIDNVLGGLSSIGLNAVQLDTQSLIELYYNTYNPTVSNTQRLVDIGQLRVVE